MSAFGIASNLLHESNSHHRSSRTRHGRHGHDASAPVKKRRFKADKSIDEHRAVYYDERPGMPVALYIGAGAGLLTAGCLVLGFVDAAFWGVVWFGLLGLMILGPVMIAGIAVWALLSHLLKGKTNYRRPTNNGLQHWR